MDAIDNELFALRMDAAALPGELILNKAIAESRGLTSIEDAGVRLAEMDRNNTWQEWIVDATRAKRFVSQFDRDIASGNHGKKPPMRLENASGLPKLYIYGDIGERGLTADDFREQLSMVSDSSPLEIRVFSYGGSFHDALAIRSLIADHSGDTIGIVDSVAASAGSMLIQACDEVEMTRGSWQMLHGVQAELKGTRTAEELQSAADLAHKSNIQLYNIYRRRWKGSDESLRKALTSDSWFDENDCVRVGLADRLSDSLALAASIGNVNFRYKNTPQSLMLSASAHADRIQLRRRLAELTLHRVCV